MSLLDVLGLPKQVNNVADRDKYLLAGEAWRKTHRLVAERIDALKATVVAHYAESLPDFQTEVEKGMARLDGVLDKIDQRLATSLASAAKATNPTARQAELNRARSILRAYVAYVKSEPLIAHIDRSPFGETDIKRLLVQGLAEAAKVIG